METKNIGHLYYKQYFNGLKLNRNTGKPKLDNPINQQLFGLQLSLYSNLIETPFKTQSVSLTTIYPGLLVGSGYLHEVGGKEIESELKLGFFFDHTTGLPVIPGSSVKGLLRSAFKKAGGNYIKEILKSLDIKYKKEISALEKAIFENSDSVSIYKRDLFFDAYPIVSGNKGSVFLANDYITHHENPLKNPNPVQFLKILPNVKVQFNFRLTDNGSLSANNKLKLFKQILLDLGIGAKTNVGYGQFTEKEPVIKTENGNMNDGDRENKNSDYPTQTDTTNTITKYTKIKGEYLKDGKYKAKILMKENGYFIIGIEDDRFVKSIETIEQKFKEIAEKRIKKGKNGNYKTIKVGDEIHIRINDNTRMNFTVMPVWID